MPLRVADRICIGSVGDDERDPLTGDWVLEQRLEMAAAIRTEDGDSDIGGGATLIRLRSVYRHRPGSCTKDVGATVKRRWQWSRLPSHAAVLLFASNLFRIV